MAGDSWASRVSFGGITKGSPDDAKTKEVEGYLRTCLSAVESAWTAGFIESLAKQWDAKGFLTPKQFAALKKIHDGL